MKKQASKSRNFFIGALLTVFTAGILGVIGFFLFVKYSQPPSLAKLLPSKETLFFVEFRTDEKTANFAQLFKEIPISTVLEFNPFGFSNSEELFAFAEKRAGLAFFGEQLNPQNFALIFDTKEQKNVLEFFEKQTFKHEKIVTQNFFHQKIYFYPQSRDLAFMFVGDDLILASDLGILQKIITAINTPKKRIQDSEAFRTIITKQNPHASGFIFLSPRFTDSLFENQFSGMQKALITPLLDLWKGGGGNFEGKNGGLEIETRFIAKDVVTRSSFFLETENLDLEILNLWGEEIQTFWGGVKLNSQLVHFLETSKNTNHSLSTLIKSLLEQATKKWFGEDLRTTDLTPLFENASTIGITTSGGVAGIFEGTFETLLEKLEVVSGKLASEEQLVELPDTTPAHELMVVKKAKIEKDLFASHKTTHLKFPDYELNFAQLENFFIFASEREVLQKMIARFVAEEKNFARIFEKNGVTGSNLFFTRIENSEIPLLQPFRFTAIGMNSETDGIKMKLFLGK